MVETVNGFIAFIESLPWWIVGPAGLIAAGAVVSALTPNTTDDKAMGRLWNLFRGAANVAGLNVWNAKKRD